MDLAQKTIKIQDQEDESQFGYVFGVSGPGSQLKLLFKMNWIVVVTGSKCRVL